MYGVIYLANRTNPTIRMHGRHSGQTTGRAKEGSMGDMLLVGLTQVSPHMSTPNVALSLHDVVIITFSLQNAHARGTSHPPGLMTTVMYENNATESWCRIGIVRHGCSQMTEPEKVAGTPRADNSTACANHLSQACCPPTTLPPS
ncbi:hypothetical protein C0Q70_09682 [Pomacea canaliculata]|uniref:Uncharacterized protein n=1 Tax=Pomacea canaliculata TaxID=400727 RepID=A0A2T7PAI2_POMCA|nr:hypothetical protein C0Q70_09682 [Pomacea canaliculata]